MKTQLQLKSQTLEAWGGGGGTGGGQGNSVGLGQGGGGAECGGREGLQWGGGGKIGGAFEEWCAKAYSSPRDSASPLQRALEGLNGESEPPRVAGGAIGNGESSEGSVVGLEDVGGTDRLDGIGLADGDVAEESDESVLQRLNAGEHRALGELWGRYAGLLFSQAHRVLHNSAEAEDVVVEVFSEVWRRSGSYHPERARPAAWLVTLVRRRAIDRFRERRSHERAEERLAQERGGSTGFNDGTEEKVRLSELRRLLEHTLKRLPDKQREAVCMVYFDGLTQREISKRTRTPIGTVKTRIELGLRKMRERIRGAQLRPQIEEGPGEECLSIKSNA